VRPDEWRCRCLMPTCRGQTGVIKQHLGGCEGRGSPSTCKRRLCLLDCAVRPRLVAMRPGRRGAPTRGLVSAGAADSTMTRLARLETGAKGDGGVHSEATTGMEPV
jgi:hypothetical protein